MSNEKNRSWPTFLKVIACTIGVLVLVPIGGCLFFYLQPPQFSGISPTAIDVCVPDVASTNVYRITITNRSACDMIVREFRQASWIFGGTKQIGTFTIHYDNGKIDEVPVMPGPSGYYTILRPPSGTYTIPIEHFRNALTNAGVDFSKFPD